jgi:formylmethanofuran dehydrogenase subunit E
VHCKPKLGKAVLHVVESREESTHALTLGSYPFPPKLRATEERQCQDLNAKSMAGKYLACIHVMLGQQISFYQEVTEHAPSRAGEAGFMVCSECGEL